MSAVLPYHGQQPLEIAILVLFAILFAWVSVGFWTAMAGFLVLVARRRPLRDLAHARPATRRSPPTRARRS